MAESGGLVVIDLEEGDLSEFSGSMGNVSATSSLPAHGNYALTSTSNWQRDYAYYNLSSQYDEIYARCYIRVDTTCWGGNWNKMWNFVIASTSSYSNRLLGFGYRHNGSGVPSFWLYGEGMGDTQTSTEGWSLDTYHYIDLHWVASSTNGGYEIWVDGSTLAADLDHSTTGQFASCIQAGYLGGDYPSNSVVFIDDIKVDTSGPIGEYQEATTGGGVVPQTFTLHQLMERST